MKPVFSVHVRITNEYTLKSEKGQINMIVFDGFIDAPFFKGEILSGACDTQKYLPGEKGALSARYMLEGLDEAGNKTRIFIENNAFLSKDGSWKTRPFIMTDNPRLMWLSDLPLTGAIEGAENGVIIHFYGEEAK